MSNGSAAIVQKLWNYCNVLPDPDIIATEIAEDLKAALEQFSQIANDLKAYVPLRLDC